MPADGEGEVALAGAVVRRVLLFTEGEGRVVAAKEDRPCMLPGMVGSSDEVGTERDSCEATGGCLAKAAALGIHEVAGDGLARIVWHEAVVIQRNCREFVITNSDGDSWFRNEANGLLVEASGSSSCRIPWSTRR